MQSFVQLAAKALFLQKNFASSKTDDAPRIRVIYRFLCSHSISNKSLVNQSTLDLLRAQLFVQLYKECHHRKLEIASCTRVIRAAIFRENSTNTSVIASCR